MFIEAMNTLDIVGADVYNESWTMPPTDCGAALEPADESPQVDSSSTEISRWHTTSGMSFPEWGTGTRTDSRGGDDDSYFITQMGAWINNNNVVYHSYWESGTIYNTRLSDGHLPLAAATFLKAFGSPRPEAPILQPIPPQAQKSLPKAAPKSSVPREQCSNLGTP